MSSSSTQQQQHYLLITITVIRATMNEDEYDYKEIVIDQEDEVQDYRFLHTLLPKMGEKDFEPDGTHDQIDKITESKSIMYQALSQDIKIHEKQVLEGIYLQHEQKTIILNVKGNYFKDIGVNSLMNITAIGGGGSGGSGRPTGAQVITLNRIETLYLLERGSLILYLSNDKFSGYLLGMINSFNIHELLPINLQYFYSQLESFEIAKYQVYAYLKRLGYLVKEYDGQFIHQHIPQPQSNVFDLFNHWFSISNSVGINVKNTHYFSYTQLLKRLIFIPNYTTYDSIKNDPYQSSYGIHYNVWKPRSLFSKKNPPKPDFQVCIANEFPKLNDIQYLFNQLNYEIEPLDFEGLDQREKDKKLRHGTGRTIILAVIDNGISFMNLSETDFKLQDGRGIHGIIH